MLRSIGGGVENDKLLQMLIALLILMQLIQESTGEGAGRGSGQSRSLLSTQGQGSFVMMSATSTTISVEQTSVYMVSGAGPASLEAAPETQPTGNRMDVSA